jgi:TolA-binding protein
MGEFYFNEGDFENALIYYNKAIDNYPSSIPARTMLNKINNQINK